MSGTYYNSFHLFSENDLSQPVDDINLSAEIKILGKFEGERGLSITFRDFQDPFNSENKEDFQKIPLKKNYRFEKFLNPSLL